MSVTPGVDPRVLADFLKVAFHEQAICQRVHFSVFVDTLRQYAIPSEANRPYDYSFVHPDRRLYYFETQETLANGCLFALSQTFRVLSQPDKQRFSIPHFFGSPFLGALVTHWNYWCTMIGRPNETPPEDPYMRASLEDLSCMMPYSGYIAKLCQNPQQFAVQCVDYQQSSSIPNSKCPRCSAYEPSLTNMNWVHHRSTITALLTTWIFTRATLKTNRIHDALSHRTGAELFIALVNGHIPPNLLEWIGKRPLGNRNVLNIMQNAAFPFRDALRRHSMPPKCEILGLLQFVIKHVAEGLPYAFPQEPFQWVQWIPGRDPKRLCEELVDYLPFQSEHLHSFLDTHGQEHVISCCFVGEVPPVPLEVARMVQLAGLRPNEFLLVSAVPEMELPTTLITTQEALFCMKCRAISLAHIPVDPPLILQFLFARPFPGTSEHMRQAALQCASSVLHWWTFGESSTNDDSLFILLFLPWLFLRFDDSVSLETLLFVMEAVLHVQEPHEIAHSSLGAAWSSVHEMAPEEFPHLRALPPPERCHVSFDAFALSDGLLREILQLAASSEVPDAVATQILSGIRPSGAPLIQIPPVASVPPATLPRIDAPGCWTIPPEVQLGTTRLLKFLWRIFPVHSPVPLIDLNAVLLFPAAIEPAILPFLLDGPFAHFLAENLCGFPLETLRSKSDYCQLVSSMIQRTRFPRAQSDLTIQPHPVSNPYALDHALAQLEIDPSASMIGQVNVQQLRQQLASRRTP